ncbi:hypothetical protein ACFVGY_05305 [Streptomyces sp. NPDC127106]|uniref:hypothetical protein n=1 Tax=Streptomyces sp. NPDC127106 TaxID=3345360 RepID=UPI0036442B2B
MRGRTRAGSRGTATPATEPAAELLGRLRLVDPRLMLAVRDVQRLVPAVEARSARSANPAQITRTLTANLPPEPVPIHHRRGSSNTAWRPCCRLRCLPLRRPRRVPRP